MMQQESAGVAAAGRQGRPAAHARRGTRGERAAGLRAGPGALRAAPSIAARLVRLARSRNGRLALTAGSAALALGLSALAVRHFTVIGWPPAHGHPGLLVAAALLFLVAYTLKAHGWRRLFAADERPRALALAAANGGASVTGVALPGRFDDVVRIAIVRRSPRCPAGVRSLCLSLFMLGLIDSVALAPLAAAAAVFPGHAVSVRAGLALVAGAGIGAAALVLTLPRIAASRRLLRFRLARWLTPRATPWRGASQAWALVSACWLVRVVALVLLLGSFGIGLSFPLALFFLCAGAAASALPIGPAGAATQVGAGAAVLVASGVEVSQAVGFAVAVQAIGVLAGGAILLFATLVHISVRLAPSRRACADAL
jgi:uncharacterized membrane protein YbhN (UPF0104 family)